MWSTFGSVFGFTSGFRDGSDGWCAGSIDRRFGTEGECGFGRNIGHLEGQVGEGE